MVRIKKNFCEPVPDRWINSKHHLFYHTLAHEAIVSAAYFELELLAVSSLGTFLKFHRPLKKATKNTVIFRNTEMQ